MTDYQPIQCTDYDQYEAYCIRHAQIVITVLDGQEFTGQAIDLLNIKNQGEFLVLADLKPEKGEQRVRLDMIKNVAVI